MISETGTSWPDLYKQAILEPDPTLLSARIIAAREAIQHRARELWYQEPAQMKERRDLDHAIRFLELLGKTRTGA